MPSLNGRRNVLLGPFNRVPPPLDKVDQQIVLSVVLALSLLISVFSLVLPPVGAELPAEEAERSMGWSHLIYILAFAATFGFRRSLSGPVRGSITGPPRRNERQVRRVTQVGTASWWVRRRGTTPFRWPHASPTAACTGVGSWEYACCPHEVCLGRSNS